MCMQEDYCCNPPKRNPSHRRGQKEKKVWYILDLTRGRIVYIEASPTWGQDKVFGSWASANHLSSTLGGSYSIVRADAIPIFNVSTNIVPVIQKEKR
jgi:hypothetical protein